jgi:hypothetical protein
MAQNFLSDIQLGDSTYIRLGDATNGDLQVYHGGTHSFIDNQTGNLYIRNYSDDKNIHFQTDDGSGDITDYIVINGSENIIKFQEHSRYLDNKEARFGTGSDLKIWHSGSVSQIRNNTGDLYITTSEDDSDIVFYADNGAGTSQPRLTINGATGAVSLNHYTDTRLTTTSAGLDISGDVDIDGELNFQKTGFTTITGSSNTFNINFATETNNYKFTLDNAACTIAFANLTNVVGKSGNIIITNPSSVGSLSVGNLPSEAYSPGGATINWDTNASSVSILSYFILASDKVLINYVGNFKSYGT